MVGAEALDATMPAWDFGVSNLNQMPLSTFLLANLDARSKVESKSIAVRSVAWIAADDAVDVVDGSPENWSDAARQLIDVRLQVVEIAIMQTRQRIMSPSPRLVSVHDSVASLRHWIAHEAPPSPWAAEEHPSLSRLRTQWNRWGPVRRHPLMAEAPPTHMTQAQPRLRTEPDSMHYRTL